MADKLYDFVAGLIVKNNVCIIVCPPSLQGGQTCLKHCLATGGQRNSKTREETTVF